MSDLIPAELPPLPTPKQIADLSQTLDRGFKSAQDGAKALKAQFLRAKLKAMRLAPIPASPREAMSRAAEARRLVQEAKNLGDWQTGTELAEAMADAREVAAKGRRAVKPGSPEDRLLIEMELGLLDGIVISV